MWLVESAQPRAPGGAGVRQVRLALSAYGNASRRSGVQRYLGITIEVSGRHGTVPEASSEQRSTPEQIQKNGTRPFGYSLHRR